MKDPTSSSLTTAERIALILAIALIAVLVPGTIPVEECRIMRSAFSSGFDVAQCKRSALAVVLAHKVEGSITVAVAH
jgi:hypothetical protein